MISVSTSDGIVLTRHAENGKERSVSKINVRQRLLPSRLPFQVPSWSVFRRAN
jgi:hypothetical protein